MLSRVLLLLLVLPDMDNFRRMQEALIEVDTPVKKLGGKSDVMKKIEVKEENSLKEGSERISLKKPDVLQTKHTNCPLCGSVLNMSGRSEEKNAMTIYGESGVTQRIHIEGRCNHKSCRY